MVKTFNSQFANENLSLEELVLLNKDQIFNKDNNLDVSEELQRERSPLRLIANRMPYAKKSSSFSSLDRIRVVVDSLTGEKSHREICREEGVSVKTFLKWKEEFLTAFKKYSEIEVLQQSLSANAKKQIVDEVGRKPYNYFKKFSKLTDTDSLILPKGKLLSNYSDFVGVKNIVLLNKLNDYRFINKQLEEVNAKLENGDTVMGYFETFREAFAKKPLYNLPMVKHFYIGFDFVFKRVFPKLPVLKKLYFTITKGKNRRMSKAEALGRLVSCGFDIEDYKIIDGIHYFVAKKVKEPAYDMNPSYGPLFKMRRVGKGGKIIGVYKFRTMHPYSEYLQDYVLKINGYADSGKPANDFRLVPWGKFLRRYWLDELPQLINVFKGELKLVGARPVSQRYFQDIPKDIQELRLKQKPGCIPPYVALDRSGSVNSVLGAEKEYLTEKLKNPYTTDMKYFFKAIYNIVFKRKRSA